MLEDGLMENRVKEKNKEKVWNLQVIIVMKVIFLIIKNLVLGQLNIIMEMSTRDNGKMAKWMEKEYILIKIIQFIIKDNGVIVN